MIQPGLWSTSGITGSANQHRNCGRARLHPNMLFCTSAYSLLHPTPPPTPAHRSPPPTSTLYTYVNFVSMIILSVPLGILVLLQIPYSFGWAVGSLPSCISGGASYQLLLQRFYSFATVLYIFSCHPKFSFAFQVAMGKSAVPHLLG